MYDGPTVERQHYSEARSSLDLSPEDYPAERGLDPERSERFRAAARRIGERLCAQAIWHGEMCNWFGRCSKETDDKNQLIPTVSALGTDLYSGSAGIAVFLAQLHALSPSATLRRTALGALRHSLANAPMLGVHRAGLYNGTLGVAYAAGRVGFLLEDEALCTTALQRAKATLAAVLAAPAGPWRLDIVAGHAGSILALLALRRLSGGDSLLGGAVTLGELLLRRAERQRSQYLWFESPQPVEDPTGPLDESGRPLPLTGYSHGTGGIGLALVELHAATGEPVLREAGLGAFAYEDRWFSARHDNWPDLRAWVRGAELDEQEVFGQAWCHGAPGMLIARARAAALLPKDKGSFSRYLAAAAQVTQRLLRTWGPGRDATLCHGAAGLGEALLYTSLLLPEAARYWCDAEQLGEELAAGGRGEDEWKSGTPSGGPNPSLMLGTAGVGYYLLRLAESARVPSMLGPPHW